MIKNNTNNPFSVNPGYHEHTGYKDEGVQGTDTVWFTVVSIWAFAD